MGSERMTRRQVAKRIGKSVATVRKLEGVLLHPTRDSRGVHWFDGPEVDSLARAIEQGDVTVWRELRDATAGAEDAFGLEASDPDELDRLRRENDDLRQRLEDRDARHRVELNDQEHRYRREMEQLRFRYERDAMALVRESERLIRQIELLG